MRELLLILRQNALPKLPKTAQTFLKTSSAKYDIESWENGQFVYSSTLKGLKACLNSIDHEEFIDLQFIVDGISLFKSSSLF